MISCFSLPSKTPAALALILFGAGLTPGFAAGANGFILRREAWSFNRSKLSWPDPGTAEQRKRAGTIGASGPNGCSVVGWAEYEFELPAAGWYELLEQGGVLGWPRDVYLDGNLLFPLVVWPPGDAVLVDKHSMYKEANLYLKAGKHTLRFRRLAFPGILPSAWELRAAWISTAWHRALADKQSIRIRRSGKRTVPPRCWKNGTRSPKSAGG